MYGYWFVAWRLLGFTPLPYKDDLTYRFFVSSQFVPILFLTIFAPLPVGLVSVGLNIAYVLNDKPSASQAGFRALTFVSFWLGWFMWFVNDPHEVITWFFD